jgi:type VI secretion system protein ImpF
MSDERKNRLSPPLMQVFRAAHVARDARKRPQLREAGPGQGSMSRTRAVQRVAITEPMLRNEVRRDIDMLMNCVALESTQDITAFEAVRTSILNYGLPDIAHRTIDELEANDLIRDLEAAIRRYEPRLSDDSVRVERDRGLDPTELKIRYNVHADLRCDPLDVPVQFVAEVEVDTGKITINRL